MIFATLPRLNNSTSSRTIFTVPAVLSAAWLPLSREISSFCLEMVASSSTILAVSRAASASPLAEVLEELEEVEELEEALPRLHQPTDVLATGLADPAGAVTDPSWLTMASFFRPGFAVDDPSLLTLPWLRCQFSASTPLGGRESRVRVFLAEPGPFFVAATAAARLSVSASSRPPAAGSSLIQFRSIPPKMQKSARQINARGLLAQIGLSSLWTVAQLGRGDHHTTA